MFYTGIEFFVYLANCRCDIVVVYIYIYIFHVVKAQFQLHLKVFVHFASDVLTIKN